MRVLSTIAMPPEWVRRVEALDGAVRWRFVGRENPEATAAVAEADVLLGQAPACGIEGAERLRWWQLLSAGADKAVALAPPRTLITTASGVFDVPVAEHTLSMMLAFARGLPEVIRAGVEARWAREGARFELAGQTCCVIGMGHIGRAVACRAAALQMRVSAVDRTADAEAEGVDELYPADRIDEAITKADHVVVTLPGTAQTRHLFDSRRLDRMKPRAYLYNVGRGWIVEEAALIEALRAGTIAGAGLDVFETEPLPAESPLWRMPNVLVTPHCAGQTPRHRERLGELFLENLQRYVRGEPLRNVVDREKGY